MGTTRIRRACCALAATVALWLLMPDAAEAGTIRHDVADSNYTTLAAQTQFDAVGWINIGGVALGSATLINDRTLLTAAHCLDGSPGFIQFTASDGSVYNASNWTYHSSWTGSLSNGYDIGVVTLSSAVSNITPATLYDATDEVGQTLTAVGYGKTGTGLTGSTLASGTRRAGDNVIDGVGGGIVGSLNLAGYASHILFADFDSPLDAAESTMGSSTPLALEYSTAPGDSGGGHYVEADGSYYLAGVTSFGASIDGSTDSDYGDIIGTTRVSSFISWISANITGSITTFSDDGGGGGGGFGVAPEPASLGILSAAAWGLYLSGRRMRDLN